MFLSILLLLCTLENKNKKSGFTPLDSIAFLYFFEIHLIETFDQVVEVCFR